MKLFITLLCGLCLLALTGCGLNLQTPYGRITQDSDSQIFTYTDADVKVTETGIVSDDTTVIIVGVKDSNSADLESIFNHAMDRIKDIFHARQQVYKEWVKK